MKYWSSPEELGGQVAKSLIQIRKTHPAEGWVRGRNAITPEVEREIVELRAKVLQLSAQLETEKGIHTGPVESLAQGDDEYTMDSWIYYEVKSTSSARSQAVTKTKFVKFSVTWNRVFQTLGPLLMDESSESRLDEELDNLSVELYLDDEKNLKPSNACA